MCVFGGEGQRGGGDVCVVGGDDRHSSPCGEVGEYTLARFFVVMCAVLSHSNTYSAGAVHSGACSTGYHWRLWLYTH